MIDHIVYATRDLEATVEALGRTTGVIASVGGRHLARGTRNDLADLGGGTYLEVIGPDPDQPHPAKPLPFGLDEVTHPVLVAWAVRVTDMAAALVAARAAGWDPGEATPMARERPDGVVLHWTLTAWEPPHAFLIDWGTTPHPAESAVKGLTLVSLAVPEWPTSVTSDTRLVRGAHLAAVIDGPRGRLSL